VQIKPLNCPIRRGLRPSSSPEYDPYVEPYLVSILNLSEVCVGPLSGSFAGGGRFRFSCMRVPCVSGGGYVVFESIHISICMCV